MVHVRVFNQRNCVDKVSLRRNRFGYWLITEEWIVHYQIKLTQVHKLYDEAKKEPDKERGKLKQPVTPREGA